MRHFDLAADLHAKRRESAAFEQLRQALDLDPRNVRAKLLLGFMHMQRQEFDDAESEVRDALEILDEREKEGRLVAEAQNMLGVILIHRGQYSEAIPVLRKSATNVLNSNSHLAWGNLGLARYHLKEYKEALRALGESVRAQPMFCVGYYRIGQTYFALEQFEQAEEALNHAIEAADECADSFQDAWKLRGEVRARLGRSEQAVEDFERCVELGEQTSSGRSCRRYLEVAH